jgi:hypothetical protein
VRNPARLPVFNPAMKSSVQLATWQRRLLWLLLLTCVGAGVVAVLRPAPPAAFIVLHRPFQMPVPFRDRVNWWIPQTTGWAWAWRLEQVVFGQRKPVNIYAEIVSLASSTRVADFGLDGGARSFTDTNSLQVWLLSPEQLKALREHLRQTGGAEVVARPRISTAEGIQSSLFQGQTVSLGGPSRRVGLAIDCCALVHADAIDLTARISLSELVTNQSVAPHEFSPLAEVSVQTNLDAAVRLQVPKGNGIFLFDGSFRESGRKPVGVLIEPPQPKR